MSSAPSEVADALLIVLKTRPADVSGSGQCLNAMPATEFLRLD